MLSARGPLGIGLYAPGGSRAGKFILLQPSRGTVDSTGAEDALELRTDLLEVLKQLNRNDAEGSDVPGLEIVELHHILARGPLPQLTRGETRRALEVLMGNGLVSELDDVEYAWDRARTVAKRFAITVEGKRFLLKSLERLGRV